MRNIFPLLLLLLSWAGPAHAQVGGPAPAVPVVLRWTTYASLRPPGASPDAEPRRVPSFVGAHHGPTEAVGTYTLRVPGTVGTGELRDAVYEPFSAADAQLLGSATLPPAPTLSLRTGTEARQPYSYVLLQPVRRNPQTGQAERLLSFTYAYQLAAGGGAASRTPSTRVYAPASVLRSGDWYKIGVPRNGVYKLDLTTLQKLGLPASVNPQQGAALRQRRGPAAPGQRRPAARRPGGEQPVFQGEYR